MKVESSPSLSDTSKTTEFPSVVLRIKGPPKFRNNYDIDTWEEWTESHNHIVSLPVLSY